MKESNYKKLTAIEADNEIMFYSDHGYVSRFITEDDFRTIRKERSGRFGSKRLGCIFFGEGGFVCSQCVSVMAFSQKSQEAKLEFTGKSAYLVLATYMEVDGKPCVLESVKNSTEIFL